MRNFRQDKVKMKKITYIIALIISLQGFAQETPFTKMIDTTLRQTIPYIKVDELKAKYTDYVILDARELAEYQTSHLKGAQFVGYTKFKIKKILQKLPKNKPVVVYCSIGYRSEKIAEKLQKKGIQVYNLYGGIFDWKNKNNTVIDTTENPTENVHTYNEEWSKWLKNGIKIYKKEAKKSKISRE